MADNKLVFSIDITGTKEQTQELGQLESELDAVKRSMKELQKVEKQQGALTAEQSKERARLKTQLVGTRNAYNDLQGTVLKQNDALRKNSGFVNGVRKGVLDATKALAGIAIAYQAVKKAAEAVNKINKDAIRIYNEDRKAAIVFGDTLGYVTAQAEKNAHAVGLTVREYKSASAATQDLLVPLGFARGNAAKFSTELTNLSGALSLWDTKGRSATEVSEILTKALLGEAEQAKSLGIVIDQSSKEYNKRIKALQASEGVTAAQAKAMDILEQITTKTTDAQANFANSTENLGLQQAQSTAQLREAYEVLVVQLTPAFIGLTDAVAVVLKGLADLAEFGGIITEDDNKEIEEIAKSTEEYGLKVIKYAEAQGESNQAIYENLLLLSKKKKLASENDELTAKNVKTLEAQSKALKSVAETFAIENNLIGKNSDELKKLGKELEDPLKLTFEIETEDGLSISEAFKLELENLSRDIGFIADDLMDEFKEPVDNSIYDLIKTNEEAAAKIEAEWKDAYKSITNSALDASGTVISGFYDNQVQKAQQTAEIQTQIQKDKLDKGLITEAEYTKNVEELQKEVREREKQASIAQAIIDGAAAAIKGIAQFGPPPSPAGIAAIAGAALVTGAQIAVIEGQTFADGGVFEGKSHQEGGIKGQLNGRPVEVEGDEMWIANKKAKRSVKKHTITGTPEQIVSMVNEAYGGRGWKKGAKISDKMNVDLTNGGSTFDRMLTAELNDARIVRELQRTRKETVNSTRKLNETLKLKNNGYY